VDDKPLMILGLLVEITRGKIGKWQEDKLSIRAPKNKKILEENVLPIVEYLYNEGFISDRRIDYEIIYD